MRKLLGILFLVSQLFFDLRAQYALSPLNPSHTDLVRDHIARDATIRQTAFWPFLMEQGSLDSVYDADSKKWQRKEYTSWVLRKLRNEHLLEVNEEDFSLFLDAGWDLEASYQKDDDGRRMFTNTRGLQLTGTVGERVFFASSFYENQSIFPTYLDSIVSKRGSYNNEVDPERGSVPGFGRWKPFNTSDSYDYDYTLGTGYVGVVLFDRSFVQLGHDKQFLGYGHRSMLLSDVSAPYPLLRVHLSFLKDKLTYTTTWAVLQSLERIAPNYNNKEAMFRRLGGRFSYLHFEPVHWAGIGVFDGSTWTWRDNNHPSSIEYYLPYGALYTGNGIRNHVLGLNGHVSPFSSLNIYGQFAVQTRTNGKAAQIGARFSGLPEGLILNLEYNHTGVGFYYDGEGDARGTIITEPFQAGTDALDYYQHNDQSLAHPILMSNDEFLVRISYRFKDAFVRGSYHNVSKLPLMTGHSQDYFNFELGYTINPKSNAQIVVGNINRTERDGVRSMIDTYTYVAFRTNLINRYRDF
ncbi:MAG: hypothetical protein RLP15_10795 [Cryomorphaceae bacterium]